MAEISAEARISAPAEKVWAQLTDWSAYGEWNATHTSFPKGARRFSNRAGPFRRT